MKSYCAGRSARSVQRISCKSQLTSDDGTLWGGAGPWQRRSDDASATLVSGGGYDFLGRLDQRLHGGDRLFEHRPFLGIQLDMDDALDAAFADHHRHADKESLHAIFAVELGG